jgi:hypothetical protein
VITPTFGFLIVIMSMHGGEIGTTQGNGGRKTRFPEFTLPINFEIADAQMIAQKNAANDVGIYHLGRDASQFVTDRSADKVYGLVSREIAFSIKQPPPLPTKTGSTRKAAPRSNSKVLTTLNGFDTPDSTLRKAMEFASSTAMLDKKQSEEFIRTAVASQLELRGVVQTDSPAGVAGTTALRIVGTCSMPAVLGTIAAGSWIEAVPMTPNEYQKIAKAYVNTGSYVAAKAQFAIREINRSTMSAAIASDVSVLMTYHDKIVAAYGKNSIPMELLGGVNGIWRSQLYAGLQMLALFVKRGFITHLAGVPITVDGVTRTTAAIPKEVGGTINPQWQFLTSVATQQNGRRFVGDVPNNTQLVLPRPEVQEIASVLGVLLGMIPSATGTTSPFDVLTRDVLMDPVHKKFYMDIQKELQQCINCQGSQGNQHLHGIAALQGNPVNASYAAVMRKTDGSGGYIGNPTTSAGQFLKFQQSQPEYLIQSLMTAVNVKLRGIIGRSINDGTPAAGVDPGVHVLIGGGFGALR